MATPSFDPLEVSSVADRVYAVVRERILTGDLARDARLHQEAISAELGVSRTPVREALARLAADGLVELLPNRGARVAEVSPGDMAAAYEARLVVEPVAARLAAARRDEEGLTAMREAVADQRRACAAVKEAYRANRRFHLALVEAADNPFLLRFVEAIWAGRIGLHVYLEQAAPAELEADADEHARIVEAVAAGDGEEAERLTREHIERALGKLNDARDGAVAPGR